jgi:hypothetical protein
MASHNMTWWVDWHVTVTNSAAAAAAAVAAGLDLVVCIADGIPQHDMVDGDVVHVIVTNAAAAAAAGPRFGNLCCVCIEVFELLSCQGWWSPPRFGVLLQMSPHTITTTTTTPHQQE